MHIGATTRAVKLLAGTEDVIAVAIVGPVLPNLFIKRFPSRRVELGKRSVQALVILVEQIEGFLADGGFLG